MLANLEGRNIFDEHPIGPFGTVENPYIVESLFDERIGQCSHKKSMKTSALFAHWIQVSRSLLLSLLLLLSLFVCH